ncbi:hypothetical protein HGM15179_015320 [Zosterops borbonicus]|uniref:Uncharacterized protein n=1 Tax=Zosterops borbonicus TaxID=364589 RepID=A0A8K1G5B5_9PASS|nr:hypothetical protein HGM15179_015320 [Zosterops borbonicus]
MQSPALGSWQSQAQLQAGQRSDDSSPEEKDLVVMAGGKLNVSRQRKQPSEPNAFWAESKGVWPAGKRRRFCPSALLLWDPTCSAVDSSGVPTEGGHGTVGVSSEEGQEVDKRNTSPMKTG